VKIYRTSCIRYDILQLNEPQFIVYSFHAIVFAEHVIDTDTMNLCTTLTRSVNGRIWATCACCRCWSSWRPWRQHDVTRGAPVSYDYTWSLVMREIRQRTTVSTSIDPDLVTRTSWVDAYTAYVQIAKVYFNFNDRW